MDFMFTVPEEDFEEESGVDYDIVEDEQVFKIKSDQYTGLIKELERYKKMQQELKK